MKIIDLLSENTIDLEVTAIDKKDVLKKAVKLISASNAINDLATYEAGVFKREEESTTGVGEGIAIPHCKSKAVTRPALAAMKINGGVEYNALDGEKVDLLFLIAAPNTDSNVHLEVLARLSNLLMHEEFKTNLMNAKSKAEFLKVIDDAENEKKIAEANKEIVQYPKILAATACPTGIAHTYMAQEALENAAKKLGYTIKVETNGTGGTKNKLTDEEIEHADAIIVAADAAVETERFYGKRVIQCAVSRAIHNAETLIKDALDPNCPIFGDGNKVLKSNKKDDIGGSKFHIFYKHLMSGISHMIPFVVAGGILLAIAYLIDLMCGIKTDIVDSKGIPLFGNVTIGAKIFHALGADFGLGLMLPVLGGFIAYDIAGRPGLVSGFIGGIAASKGTYSLLYLLTNDADLQDQLSKTAAGFLGAIIAGFIAGYVTLLFKNKILGKLPPVLEGLKDILLVPLLSTFVTGIAMLLINVPLAFVNIGIAQGMLKLNELKLTMLLAALVAALMATDMGGPINKAAHYATLMILQMALAKPSEPQLLEVAKKLMCANIVGIMTPPIGIAIATWLFPQKFSKEDRNPSIANCVTGVCGITEGAIPYVAKDPIRVLISTITGAAIGGVIAFALGGKAIAPEGGTISMLIMVDGCWKGLLATLIGSLITGLLLGFLKKDVDPESAKLKKWKGIPTQPVYNFFGKTFNIIKGVFKKDKNKNESNKEEK